MPKKNPIKKDKFGRRIPKIPTDDLAMRRFAKHLDMDAFRWMLAGGSTTDRTTSTNEKLICLCAMLSDPAYKQFAFATLVSKAHLTLQELQEVYSNGMRHIGLLRMASHLPDVMEDVANDAKNTMENCPRCDGYKVIPDGENGTRACTTCKGTGEVKRMGDKHARDLMFETAKLTKQSGGPTVQINQAFTTIDSRMETMLKRTRSIVLDSKANTLDTPPTPVTKPE
jgi:hypothetical protein